MLINAPSSLQSFLSAPSFIYASNSDSLGFTYLTATTSRWQPLCGNAEGWGPPSPFRHYFTECFLDMWISTVAVFGIVFGSGTVWWLITRKDAAEVAKDWHFWTKLVSDGLS
jgi:ATP-binding cassette subfamily C (CFTR/MRP) protein 1